MLVQGRVGAIDGKADLGRDRCRDRLEPYSPPPLDRPPKRVLVDSSCSTPAGCPRGGRPRSSSRRPMTAQLVARIACCSSSSDSWLSRIAACISVMQWLVPITQERRATVRARSGAPRWAGDRVAASGANRTGRRRCRQDAVGLSRTSRGHADGSGWAAGKTAPHPIVPATCPIG
jgi:hypothetical protein